MSAVLVQNTKRGIVAFADPPNNIEYEWKPAGTPGDIQVIPEKVVTENANFIRALRGGTLRVVEANEDTQAKINEQNALLSRKAELQSEAIAETIDRQSDRVVAAVEIQEDGRKAGAVSVISDTETFDEDGRPIITEQAVIIEPRV